MAYVIEALADTAVARAAGIGQKYPNKIKAAIGETSALPVWPEDAAAY